jgi:hypothetical protein
MVFKRLKSRGYYCSNFDASRGELVTDDEVTRESNFNLTFSVRPPRRTQARNIVSQFRSASRTVAVVVGHVT